MSAGPRHASPIDPAPPIDPSSIDRRCFVERSLGAALGVSVAALLAGCASLVTRTITPVGGKLQLALAHYPELGEPGGDHHQRSSPGADGIGDRLDHLRGRHADQHHVERSSVVVASLGERPVGTPPEHLRAATVHQEHGSVTTGLQCAPTEDVPPLGGITARADHRDRSRVEEGVQRRSGLAPSLTPGRRLGLGSREGPVWRPLTPHPGEPSITD